MSNLSILLPKDDQELPDHYGVFVYFHGETKPLEIQIVTHRIFDKVFRTEIVDGKSANKAFAANPCPYFEYKTTDDETGFIPMNSIKRLQFDKNFTKILTLKEKRNEKSV